jgi:hypothetical protein
LDLAYIDNTLRPQHLKCWRSEGVLQEMSKDNQMWAALHKITEGAGNLTLNDKENHTSSDKHLYIVAQGVDLMESSICKSIFQKFQNAAVFL